MQHDIDLTFGQIGVSCLYTPKGAESRNVTVIRGLVKSVAFVDESDRLIEGNGLTWRVAAKIRARPSLTDRGQSAYVGHFTLRASEIALPLPGDLLSIAGETWSVI